LKLSLKVAGSIDLVKVIIMDLFLGSPESWKVGSTVATGHSLFAM